MSANFLVAVWTFGKLRHANGVMRAARGRPALGMAAFWIRHSFPSFSFIVNLRLSIGSRSITRTYLGPEVLQFAPAVIDGVRLAAAILLVAVLPANGTDALAGLAADQLHGQS